MCVCHDFFSVCFESKVYLAQRKWKPAQMRLNPESSCLSVKYFMCKHVFTSLDSLHRMMMICHSSAIEIDAIYSFLVHVNIFCAADSLTRTHKHTHIYAPFWFSFTLIALCIFVFYNFHAGHQDNSLNRWNLICDCSGLCQGDSWENSYRPLWTHKIITSWIYA